MPACRETSLLLLMSTVVLATAAVGRPLEQETRGRAVMKGDAMFETGVVTLDVDSMPREFAFRLMKPDPDAGPGPYPLVVFLHGAGERGSDNESHLKYLPTRMAREENRKRFPCYLLAVQCPSGDSWVSDERIDGITSVPKSDASPMRVVIAAMDKVIADEDVDVDRIYLTGLSMGGYGAWQLAALQPERFAGVLPICGGGDPATAPALKDLDILVFHGADDRVVPERESRVMVEAVKRAGGSVEYKVLPGVAHDSWSHAYGKHDAIEWLFDRKRAKGP